MYFVRFGLCTCVRVRVDVFAFRASFAFTNKQTNKPKATMHFFSVSICKSIECCFHWPELNEPIHFYQFVCHSNKDYKTIATQMNVNANANECNALNVCVCV